MKDIYWQDDDTTKTWWNKLRHEEIEAIRRIKENEDAKNKWH